MLRQLWDQRDHRHLVEDIAKGRREMFDVYDLYVENKLEDAHPADDKASRPLTDALDEWLAEFQASEHHKTNIRHAMKQLLAETRGTALVANLPDLLAAYRSTCVREQHPSAFRYAKQAALALIRDTLGKRHLLRAQVADVPSMPVVGRGVMPLTVDEARDACGRLAVLDKTSVGAEAARIFWAMCCSGMGSAEFWGEWELLPDRVRIKGKKRAGRSWGGPGREVPLVHPIERPTITPGRYAKLLHRVGVSPYQGRKSFATWMEDAEIPRTRRRLYLGHAAGDVTDRYERREITAFLQEDRGRLLSVLGDEQALTLMKSIGAITTGKLLPPPKVA